MKMCKLCSKTLPLTTDFWHKSMQSKDGWAYRCKKCSTAKLRDWQINNPEKNLASAKRHRIKRRFETLCHYSSNPPFCVCCGETTLVFLVLDHIDGGGNQHKRDIKNGPLDQWLKSNDYPEGFQVLCQNCNWAKYMGGCPHKISAPTQPHA